MYQAGEKANSITGSIAGNEIAEPSVIKWEPDKPNYDFLPEDQEFSILKHSALLNKLRKAIDDSYIWDHITFTKDTASYLGYVIGSLIKMEHYKRVIIIDSLFPKFASRPINRKLIFDIALMIAGNMNILAMDMVIVPDYDLKYPAWLHMAIKDVTTNEEKPSIKKVVFYAEAGIFAGSTITKHMTSKFIKFVLSQIGMPRRKHSDAMDIFNTRFSVLMTKDRSGSGMSEFAASASQMKYNKELFKVRHGDRPCHNGMICACHECILGTDKCIFAVYKQSEKEAEQLCLDQT